MRFDIQQFKYGWKWLEVPKVTSMPFSHYERQNTEIERQYRLILFFMSECTKSECTIDYWLKDSNISYNNLNLKNT